MAETKKEKVWRADTDQMIAEVREAIDRLGRVVHRRGGDVHGEALNLSLAVEDLLHQVERRESSHV